MSVEHAYVAAKVGHVPSLLTCTAGQAKRLGRSRPMLAGFEDGKFLIMAGLLRQKFAIPALRALLQETGDADLVEGNTWGDCYWGVSGGRGKNNLGRLLMWVRAKNAESLEP